MPKKWLFIRIPREQFQIFNSQEVKKTFSTAPRGAIGKETLAEGQQIFALFAVNGFKRYYF